MFVRPVKHFRTRVRDGNVERSNVRIKRQCVVYGFIDCCLRFSGFPSMNVQPTVMPCFLANSLQMPSFSK